MEEAPSDWKTSSWMVLLIKSWDFVKTSAPATDCVSAAIHLAAQPCSFSFTHNQLIPSPSPLAPILRASKSRSRSLQQLCCISPSVPLDALKVFLGSKMYVPALPLFQSTVTGRWKDASLCLNFLNASLVPVASLITLPACPGPRYSKMLLNWSLVGAPSCTSNQINQYVSSCSSRTPSLLSQCDSKALHVPSSNSVLSNLLCLL